MSEENINNVKAYYKGFRLYAVVLALCTSLLITSIDTSIVSTILTPIIQHFENYSEVTAWIIPAYTISTACCCLLAARIASKINLKYGVCLGIFIFEIGSIITAASFNLKMLFIGRCIAGIGAAFINNLIYVILIEIAEEKKLANFMSIASMAFNLGTVLGPIIGSAFIDRYVNSGWRYCFWINLPIGFSAMFLILIAYNHHNDKYFSNVLKLPGNLLSFAKKCCSFDNWRLFLFCLFFEFDITEFCFCSCGFVLLFSGLTEASTALYPWTNYRIIIMLVVGGLSILFAFAWDLFFYPRICLAYGVEPNPLIDSLCYKKVGLVATNICVFCSSCAFIMILIYLIQFFQIVLKQSTLVKIIPLFVSSSVSVLVCGKIINRTGLIKFVAIGGAMLGCVGAGLLQLLDFDMTTKKVIGYTILAGVGFGSQIQSNLIAIQQYLVKEEDCFTDEEKKNAEKQRINVNSFYSFMKLIGMATGPIIGNTIFSNLLPTKVKDNKDLTAFYHLNINQLIVYRLTTVSEVLNDDLGKTMLKCIQAVMWAALCLFAVNFSASLFLSGKRFPHTLNENNTGDSNDYNRAENYYESQEYNDETEECKMEENLKGSENKRHDRSKRRRLLIQILYEKLFKKN